MLCPACGGHRFFLEDEAGQETFFHVGMDGKPFPTEVSRADLTGLDFSTIWCTGCDWSGPIHKLTPIFAG